MNSVVCGLRAFGHFKPKLPNINTYLDFFLLFTKIFVILFPLLSSLLCSFNNEIYGLLFRPADLSLLPVSLYLPDCIIVDFYIPPIDGYPGCFICFYFFGFSLCHYKKCCSKHSSEDFSLLLVPLFLKNKFLKVDYWGKGYEL